MKIDCIIAIDPGANGGIVVYRPNHHLKAIQMPKDILELKDWFAYMKGICTPIIFIEKLNIRPDDVSIDNSNPAMTRANMGKMYRIQKMMSNFEQLKALIAISEIPFILVHPMKWQNDLNLRLKGKKEEKTERKRRYRDIAARLYPEVKVTLWNADALLIMHFGRNKLQADVNWIKTNLPTQLHNRLF